MDVQYHFDYDERQPSNDNSLQHRSQSLGGLDNRHYDGFVLSPQPLQAPGASGVGFDVDEINRLVTEKSAAPYAPGGHRPQPSAQNWNGCSYPGGSGAFTEPFHGEYPRQNASGHSSVTASDSAYHSLNVTSGGPGPPVFPGHPSQHVYGHVPTNPSESHVPFGDGQGSVASEPIGTGNPRRTNKSVRSRTKSSVPPCWCGKLLKNNSDAFKHKLQHEKPYICREPGCSRNGDGFATQNDLQRHRSSVHKQMPLVGRQNGYICVACGPAQHGTKPKFWPRRDNFKAHVRRKHSHIPVDDIIKASTRERPDDAMTVESGYGSAPPSQTDPSDNHLRQDLTSPQIPSFTSHPSQQSEYFLDLGNVTQSNQLAGVGVGAGDSTDLPMNTRESDPGMYVPDSSYDGLSVLSTAAARMDTLSSPVDSFMPTPTQSSSRVSQVLVSQHNPQIGAQPDFSTMQWSPEFDGGSRDGGGGAADDSSRDAEGNFPCQECGKVKKRECDLRKHMKRHTRPYGCTFPDCWKRFGSRNDWKRHESSQHFLQEMWRCNYPANNGYKCGELVHTRDCLKRHLEAKHPDLPKPDHDRLCNDMRLGVNAHNRFWCGFCNNLIRPSEEYVQNALEFRYKHIGDHYDKLDANVDAWVCVRANKPKGNLTNDDRKKIRGWMRTGRSDGSFHASEHDTPRQSLVHGPTGPASCAQAAHDPGMAAQSTLNTSMNKRRRLESGAEADAENVSDDEWDGGRPSGWAL